MTDINDVMKVLRNYLVNDTQIKSLLSNKQAVYLVDKPIEEEASEYIVYLYKQLEGRYLQQAQIEFRLIGKDLSKLVGLQSRLTKLLNYNRDTQIIRNEDTVIKDSKLLNGGGMLVNPNTGNYELIVFYLIKF